MDLSQSAFMKKVQLPKNFFSKVIDLENKAKIEFNIAEFQELINLYTMAVEYYEMRGDSRYQDYNARLSNVLSDKEIMLKLAVNSKTQGKPNKMKAKKKMKNLKERYGISNKKKFEETAQEMLSGVKSNIYVDSLVKDSLSKQKDDFKKRLEQKRQRAALSRSDCAIEVRKKQEELRNDRQKRKKNRSLLLGGKVEAQEQPFSIKLEVERQVEHGTGVNFAEENKEDIEDKLSALREVLENLVVSKREEKLLENISSFTAGYGKKVQSSLQGDAIRAYTDKLKTSLKEQFEEHLRIVSNYDDQIKETEMLLMNEQNDENKASLEEICSSWKEEKSTELDKMSDKYREKGVSLQNTLKDGLFSSSGVAVAGETLRLSLLNEISQLIKGNN